MGEPKKVTIIMVGRNQAKLTKKAIESLAQFTDSNKYKLLFMDNGGTDHSDSWVTHYCRDNGIELKYQYNPENVGWVKAVNKAYEMCNTEFSLTCHNDVIFCKQWLENMMRRFCNSSVAAVGPVISFAMGPQSIHYAYQTFGVDVRYILGLFFLCRMDVLREIKETHGEYLSSSYGMGDKEELELCWSIRQLGYQFEIARDVYIEHVGEKAFVETLGSQQNFYEYQNKQLQILKERLGEKEVNDIYSIQIRKPIKLMVGLLFRTEYVHYRFFISMLKIWGETQVAKMLHQIIRGHPTDRNAIVREFLKTDCTHLLFIDDDMFFEGNSIIKLLAHDVDICTGIAWQRGEPHAPCIFLANHEKKEIFPLDALKSGLVEIDTCGGYFLLIKRKVLETVEPDWFKYGSIELGYGVQNKKDKGIGEDVYFGLKSKLAGFDIYCDSDVIVGHLGQTQEIDEKFYLGYKESGKQEEAIKKMNEFKKL